MKVVCTLLVTMVASVAIGLPVALHGNSRMKSIRDRYPVIGVGLGDRSTTVRVGWKF